MINNSNLGRFDVVKTAFAAHILRGIDQFVPVTPALESFQLRERETKLRVAPDRMVDKTEELLKIYQKDPAKAGFGSPLPVVLLAFAKDVNPIAPDRGMSIANPITVALDAGESPEYFSARFDHVEARAQIAFIAHESETARAMTSQMRLFLNTFEAHRWDLNWVFEGREFTTTCSLENYEPMDELVDMEERNNITIIVWNLTLNFQMPYLRASGQEINMDGTTQTGIDAIKQVDYTLRDVTQPISTGVVNQETVENIDTSEIGRWNPFIKNQKD